MEETQDKVLTGQILINNRKEKLTIEEQIEHMKNSKGILFNIIDEVEAKEFLEKNNYFF